MKRSSVFWTALALMSVVALVCPVAHAAVEGTPPNKLYQARLWGTVTTAGATMMDEDTTYHANKYLKPENRVRITGIPGDAEAKKAYLWWSGSMHFPPSEGGVADERIDFTLADGTSFFNLRADDIGPGGTRCLELEEYGGYFYCRKDITDLVNAQGTGNYNGDYTLANLDAKTGDCEIDGNCQARYGAFAMSIVWEAQSYDHRRDVIIFDGFMGMQERNDDPDLDWLGVTQFQLSDFLVGDPARGEFVYFGMEGDRQLGSPPFPSTNGDFIKLRRNPGSGGTLLENPAGPGTPENPPYNVWNSSEALGVDIDYFDIGSDGLDILRPGQTQMEVYLGSGDGVPGVVDPSFNNHDLVILGWVAVALDTLAPSFNNTQTDKTVNTDKAAPGEVLTYTLKVTNTGSAEATNATLRDAIPANTTYVQNSTLVDGEAVPDVGGTSPLVNGLSLGTMPSFPGDNSQVFVQFQVRVNNDAPAGYDIVNTATIESDEIQPPVVVGVALTEVIAPELGAVRKTWELLGGPGGFPVPGPGSWIRYTLEVENGGPFPLSGLTLDDLLPPYLTNVSVQAPSGAVVILTPEGDSMRVTVNELTVPPSWTAQVSITAQVITEGQFSVLGIDADAIDGLWVDNQALVNAPYLPPEGVKSDDPTDPTSDVDPTRFQLVYAPVMSDSQKTVAVEGNPPTPGAQVTYTISLINSGNRPATILDLEDIIDTDLTDVAIDFGTTTVPGVTFDGTRISLSNPFLMLPSSFPLYIVFTGKIRDDAPHGTVISNEVTVDVDPDPDLLLPAPDVIVIDEPVFTDSTKSWVGENGLPTASPGELLTFTYTIVNSGTAADSVVLEDPLDLQYVEYVSGGSAFDPGSGVVTFDLGNVDQASTVDPPPSVVVRVRDAPPGTSFQNCGRVKSDELADWTDIPCVEIPLVLAPVLSIEKRIEDPASGRARPGDAVEFSITVTNSGSAEATNLVITDVLNPAQLIFTSAVPVAEFDPPTGTARWRMDRLGPSETLEIQIFAEVISPMDPGSVVNTAVLEATELPVPLESTVELFIDSDLLLGFSKDVDVPRRGDGSAVPGQRLTWTVKVYHLPGSTRVARNLGIADQLQDLIDGGWLEEATIDAGRGFYDAASKTIVWGDPLVPELVALSPGEEVELTYETTIVRPHTDGWFDNDAILAQDLTPFMTSDDPRDGAVDNNNPEKTAIDVINGPAFWDFFKEIVPVENHFAQPGDQRSYVLTLENSGTTDALDIEIKDSVPAGLTIVDAGDGVVNGQDVTWSLPLLAPAQSWSRLLTFRVDIPCEQARDVPNQATVQASNSAEYFSEDRTPPPDLPLDGQTWLRVSCSPKLEPFTKTVSWTNDPGNPAAVYPDRTRLNYEIRLTNSGGAPTPELLSVVDPIPAGLVVDPASVTGGRLEGDTILVDPFTLDPGQTLVVTYTATVAADTPPGTVISNQARARLSGVELFSDADPLQDGNQPTLVFVDYPILSAATKIVEGCTSHPCEVAPGAELTFVLTVPNQGTLEAQAAVLEDLLDPRLTLIGYDPARCDTDTGPVICQLNDIAAGTTAEPLRFTVRVSTTAPNGTEIENQATVISDGGVITEATDDPFLPGGPDPVQLLVTSEVTFEKRVFQWQVDRWVELTIDDKVARGARIRYEILLDNATGTNPFVLDRPSTLLEGITNVSHDGRFDAGEIRWDFEDLEPGSSFTLSFEARVSQRARDPIPNQARFHVDGAEPTLSDDPRTGDAGDATVFEIFEPVDFRETTKSVPSHQSEPPDLDNDRQVAPGEVARYRVTIVNTGPEDSLNARLLDQIPPWTEYVGSTTRLNNNPVDDGPGGEAPFTMAQGMLVKSIGADAGVVVGNGGSATVEFQVRVRDDVPYGTRITNRATIRDDGSDPVPTDDPYTTDEDDETYLVVGKAPSLVDTEKDTQQREVAPGQTITYIVRIPNKGTAVAQDVLFVDEIPANSNYAANSLSLNGRGLTDADDGDEGQVVNRQVVVRIGDLGILSTATVVFQVTAESEGAVRNQGTVSARGIADEPTDDPSTTQNNDETVTNVGYNRVLEASKEVVDVDGGVVFQGDELLYTITIANRGTDAVPDARLTDDIPANTQFVDASLEAPVGSDASFLPPPAGSNGNGRVTVTGISLQPQEEATVRFRVTVDAEAEPLTLIRNVASLRATGVDTFNTNRADVVVGQVTGAAAVTGVIFEDRGEPNGVYDPEGEVPDAVFAGYRVLAVPAANPDGDPLVPAVETDENGQFELVGLPAPGKFAFRVQTSTGVELGRQVLEQQVDENEVLTLDLRVNPTGRVYVSGRGNLLQGATVTLHHYDSTQDHNRGDAVDKGDLPEGQFEQVTDRYGMYQFDPPPGRYVINVTTPSELLLPLPSTSPPPTEGAAEGDPEHGFVVPSAVPDLTQDLHYHLEVQADQAGIGVHHNHIPLDHIERMIRFDLRANKRDATQGEVVTYLAEGTNGSPTDLLIDGESGGVYVRAITPRGFHYVPGSSRVEVEFPTGVARRFQTSQVNAQPDSDRNLLFGPFPLYGGGKRIRLMFQTVIGGGVRPGEREIRGLLQSGSAGSAVGAGVPIVEKDAVAKVRVIEDPLFERGYVIGKVFCDENGDGSQDTGEVGVPGVEVYVDSGSYAVTDSAGKYHLQNLPAGIRAFKAAGHTLPPGAKFTTDETRLMRLSRGALVKVNFGVTCPKDQVRPEFVELSTPADGEAEVPAGEAPAAAAPLKMRVTGNLVALTASVDGKDLPTINVDAKLIGDTGEGAGPVLKLVEDGLPAGGLRFKARVLTRDRLTGYTLDILERGGGRRHRLEGSGRPPGEIVWDGRGRDGKAHLVAGKHYDYQLTARTVSGSLGFGQLRSFGVDSGPITPLPSGNAGVLVAGRPVLPDDKGFFDVYTDVPAGLSSLGVKLIRADGKGVELSAPVARAAAPEAVAQQSRRVSGNLVALTASVDDRDLPTVNVDAWLPAKGAEPGAAQDLHLKEGTLSPSATFRTRVLAREEIHYWSIEIRKRDGGLDHRIDGLGPPDKEIPWDGRSEDGASVLQAGQVYDYQLVVRTASGSLGFGPVRSFGVDAGLKLTARAEGESKVQIGATRIRPDENGFFALQVPPDPGPTPLTVELVRPDGKGVRLLAAAPGAPTLVHSSASTERTTPVELYGSLAERTAVLDGRPLELGLLGMVCELEVPEGAPPRLEIRGKSLVQPARFNLKLPTNEIVTWHLVLGDTQGRALLVAAAGKGSPPAVVQWDGKGAAQRPLGPGLFSYRLVVRTAAGERGMSALRPLLLAAPTLELTLPGDKLFAPGKAILTRAGRKALDLRLPELRAAGGRMAVEVHSDEGRDPAAVLELTQGRADAIRRFLLRLRFKPQAVSAVGLGDVRPVVPNNNRRNRAMNRRVVLIAGAPPVTSAVLPATRRAVLVDGREIPVDAAGLFRATLALPVDKLVPVAIELRDAEGRRALLTREVDTRPRLAPVAGLSSGAPGVGAPGAVRATGDAGVAGAAVAGAEGEGPAVPPAPRRVPVAETEAPAGRLMVELPPAGAPIRSEHYRLRGVTAPGNRVTVNGVEVVLNAIGSFEHLVALEPGTNDLVIECVDESGNRTEIRRKVEVKLDYWFLLAVADGMVASGKTDLDEMNGNTTVKLADDKVALHGRAAGYFKARVRGETIFKDYRITGHFDTGKEDDEALIAHLIDPERYYPIYGDASQEVRDVNSRRQFYVLVQADEKSELRVGNFATEMQDGDLFRFDRTSFGGRAKLDHEFFEGGRSELNAFVTDTGNGAVHGHDELLGTGGSVYYLRHRNILEGSEKVMLTVRDQDTGMVLLQTPMIRDQDYIVRYSEGRLLMKSPVSSVVDATFLATSGSASTLDGHPVTLVVDYEAMGQGSGQLAWGVHGKQTLFDRVTVGGGYVTEERFGGDRYELWGASTEVKLAERSAIRAEVAHSQSAGADAFYSEDGGLTFSNFDNGQADEGGYALKLTARTEVGEWLDKPEFLDIRGYYQYMESGFFSGTTLHERGQQKFGFAANYRATPEDRLILRHDGNFAELPDLHGIADDTKLNKQISTLRYLRTLKDYSLSAEYSHTYSGRKTPDEPDIAMHSESLAAGFKYNFSERWSAFLEQQVDIPHGSSAPKMSGRDVKSTLGGAFRWDEDLWITAAVIEEWSGQTAFQAGLKSALTEDTDVYLRERVGLDLDGETTSTTMLGGENRLSRRGRIFGEYQLDAGHGPDANRAVIGLANRWKILEGLYLDLGGERQQVYSDAAGDSARTVGSVAYEYLDQDWLKLSGRYELRYDQQDQKRGGQDRLQFMTLNAGTWQWTKDLNFLTRLNYSQTENLEYEWTEALLLELSAGVAYRPVNMDWLNVLFKYTKRIELRRDSMSGFGPQKWNADVFALVPVVELPFRVQLSQTLVLRYRKEWIADLPAISTVALLSLSRINFHLTNSIDVGVEYRLLKHWLGDLDLTMQHGLLTEVSYEFLNHVRVGVGYNFSRFSDNLYTNHDEDAHGFFFRVMGKY